MKKADIVDVLFVLIIVALCLAAAISKLKVNENFSISGSRTNESIELDTSQGVSWGVAKTSWGSVISPYKESIKK